MLTRFLLPGRASVSVGRLFATSAPRWNVPTAKTEEQSEEDVYREWVMWVKGTATAPLARKEQKIVTPKKEQIAANIVTQIETLIAKRNTAEAKALLKEERIVKVSLKKRQENTSWQKLGELPSRPLSVYTAVHFASAMRPGEKIEVAMKRIHRQYTALTAKQRFPYEEKAASNFKVREAVMKRIHSPSKAEQHFPFEEKAVTNLAASAKIQGLKANPLHSLPQG